MKDINLKKIIKASFLTLCIVTVSASSYANSCFEAKGRAFSDAQSIRKIAKNMGWNVGKATSVTAGIFIRGKAKLYPQERVNVCLRINYKNELEFKAQSKSTDAGEAEWRNLLAKK